MNSTIFECEGEAQGILDALQAQGLLEYKAVLLVTTARPQVAGLLAILPGKIARVEGSTAPKSRPRKAGSVRAKQWATPQTVLVGPAESILAHKVG